MLLQKNQIIFIFLQLFIFIISSTRFNINLIRKLDESNSAEEANLNSSGLYGTNTTDEYDEIDVNCNNYTDCFNCTLNPFCRWRMSNYSCIKFHPYDENYSIVSLNESYHENDISILNKHIDFIRKVCFLPGIPYTENNISTFYNNISVKYCGPHYITTHLGNFENEFKIELKNVSGVYGLPNILCEYVILSGPYSFETDVEIDKNQTENLYLLYSEDSQYFSDHINETRTIAVGNTGRRANTFIFYGLKSFNTSPFKITFKKKISEKKSQTLGYILIGVVIGLLVIVVSSIIYIRLNSILFKKKKKIKNIDNSAEEDRMKTNNDISANCFNKKEQMETTGITENKFMCTDDINKNNDPLSPSNIPLNNNTRHTIFDNSQINQLNNVNICCYDNQIIYYENELFRARCGHIYHSQCFNKLLENNIRLFNNTQLKCVYCQTIIYP